MLTRTRKPFPVGRTPSVAVTVPLDIIRMEKKRHGTDTLAEFFGNGTQIRKPLVNIPMKGVLFKAGSL